MVEFDYLGYCKHGVLVFWQSANIVSAREAAKGVSEAMRGGLSIERGTVETARFKLASCAECKAARK